MSLGEIFAKALVNTLIGMGTVFVVLIFIACIIALMPVVVKAITGSAKKPVAETVKTAEVAAPVEEVVEDEVDDLELVAVIVAAIAASEGVSPDGFVVRSVRKSSQNRWKRV